jgi:hypothetical protein
VDGNFENVLKMKPPLAFTEADAHTLVQTIDQALTEFEQEQQGGRKEGRKEGGKKTKAAMASAPPMKKK